MYSFSTFSQWLQHNVRYCNYYLTKAVRLITDGLSAWISALPLSAWASHKEPVLNLLIARPIVLTIYQILCLLWESA